LLIRWVALQEVWAGRDSWVLLGSRIQSKKIGKIFPLQPLTGGPYLVKDYFAAIGAPPVPAPTTVIDSHILCRIVGIRF